MNKIEVFFLGKERSQDERGRLLVKFLTVTLLFTFGYSLTTNLTGFEIGGPLSRFVGGGLLLILFLLKANLNIKLAAHLFIFFCWFSVATVIFFSGGIESPAMGWFYGIPTVSFLVAQKRSAIVWTVVALLTILSYAVFKEKLIPPESLQFPRSTELVLSLHLGVLIFMLIITYIFNQQKEGMVKTISGLLNESNGKQAVINRNNIQLTKANQLIDQQHKEILDKNKNLKKQVEQRTERIVKFNKQLKDFGYMSSHNLRSSVAKILGIGQTISLEISVKEKEMLIEKLVDTTKDLDRTVRDMGKILEINTFTESELELVSLNDCLELVKRNISDQIQRKQAEVIANFHPAFEVFAVKSYMVSILQNLVDNAIKYSHPDRIPQVTITSKKEIDSTIVEVSDNGIGIDVSKYGNDIFKLHKRLNSHEKGDGIGLYLTKSHIESMGGEVTLESTPDEGSVFYLKLKKVSQEVQTGKFAAAQ